MRQEPHPDELQAQQALKAITTGGTQSADTAAMEAYYDAIEEGKTVDQAGEVFIKTYQKIVSHGNKESRINRKRFSIIG